MMFDNSRFEGKEEKPKLDIDLTAAFNKAAQKFIDEINQNREKYLEAFLAEVGLPPTEVVIIEKINLKLPGSIHNSTYFARRKKDDEEIQWLKQENATLMKKWTYASSRLAKFEKSFELEEELIPRELLDEYRERQITSYFEKPGRGNHSTPKARMLVARRLAKEHVTFELKFIHGYEWMPSHEEQINAILAGIDSQVEESIKNKPATEEEE